MKNKKNLVIVESPIKAKTIQTFLGKKYYVVSCYGHILDLPEKKMGIQIKNDFKPDYVVLSKKKKIVKELKKLICDYDVIWLASDEDREGESIAYQIYKIFYDIPNKKYNRIVFHEITKKSILSAIKNPKKINYDLVYAQQARRILDRLVGFKLSPLLWRKIKFGLSAGRVQSVVVRLIVEQEKSIINDPYNSYYKIEGIFLNKKRETIHTKLEKDIKDENDVKNILNFCKNSKFEIKKIIKKIENINPPSPFTTSSLQQDSYNKLNFSISKTMFLAQKLYEKGYITYLRTDSKKLSSSIIREIKKYIYSTYGKEYFCMRKYYKSDNKFSQEAHEAIRPTIINNDNKYLKSLNNLEKSLYKLIWERTLMGQMKNLIVEKKIFYIKPNMIDSFFIGNIKKIIFEGYTKIKKKKEKNVFLNIKIGSFLKRKEITAKKVFKKKLYRYNESSLVNNLEKLGIGRPSTYAPIISNIQKRNYVNIQKTIKLEKNYNFFSLKEKNIIVENKKLLRIEKNKLIPTEIGILINNFLINHFQEIVDYNFTANLEKKLDFIAKGKISWKEVVKNFYEKFDKKLKYVNKNVKKIYEKRFLGVEKNSNEKIFVRLAKFGPVIQLGEFKDKKKPKFFPILNNQKLETISMKEVSKIISLPKSLGFFKGKEVLLKINKYNVYIEHNKRYFPIEKDCFFNSNFSIDLKIAVDIINKKNNK